MSAAMRGCLVLIVLVVVIAFVCVGPAFIWLPRAGAGVALPVITLPAEALVPNWPFAGYDFTNTLTSMIVVDVIVLIIALVVGRALRSAPPDRFVPRGFTNFIEMLGSFLYNQAHKLLGKHTRSVFPLAASIFVFLLFANLLKLVPGYESVGLVACGEYDINADDSDPIAPGQTSYAIAGLSAENPNPAGVLQLENASLSPGGRKGEKATRADTLACEAQYPWATPPLARAIQDRTIAAQRAEVEGKTISREDFLARARDDYAYIALAEALEAADAAGEDTEVVYQAFDLEAAKAEFDAEHAEEVAHEYDEGIFNEEEARHAYHARQLAKTQGLPGNPDRLVVVPFFRGLSTDLNVPLALAIIVVLAVQFWGVRALGLPYFYKFINLPALGNLNKKPMGAIDFVVGLIEIISEISRLVSLTFRLFGALFAGGILLVVFTFLVAFILPVPIYVLELVIGGMQAYVFATLTIIYASQAVISHHGDEHTAEQHEAAH
jgi:F0F1-type ATP synthase membrane subunit a